MASTNPFDDPALDIAAASKVPSNALHSLRQPPSAPGAGEKAKAESGLQVSRPPALLLPTPDGAPSAVPRRVRGSSIEAPSQSRSRGPSIDAPSQPRSRGPSIDAPSQPRSRGPSIDGAAPTAPPKIWIKNKAAGTPTRTPPRSPAASPPSSPLPSPSNALASPNEASFWESEGEEGELTKRGTSDVPVLGDLLKEAQITYQTHSFVHESPAQFSSSMTAPVGACIKFEFVSHGPTKTFQLHYKGKWLLLAKKTAERASGLSSLLPSTPSFDISFGETPHMVTFRLRSNAQGSQFMLYDDGMNPMDPSAFGVSQPKNFRKELAAVLIENVSSNRLVTLVLPRSGTVVQPQSPAEGLLARDVEGDSQRFVSSLRGDRNAFPPLYSFVGLAALASIKNFILHPAESDATVLAAGKTSKTSADVLVQGSAISPLVGFAATLAVWSSALRPAMGKFADKMLSGQSRE